MKPYLHIVDRDGGSISLPCPETRGARKTGTRVRSPVMLGDVLIFLRPGRNFLSSLTVQLLYDPSSLKDEKNHVYTEYHGIDGIQLPSVYVVRTRGMKFSE